MDTPGNAEPQGLDLRAYLRIFRAHWIGIVVLTLLGVAVAGGAALLQPKVYQADASAYVRADLGTDANAQLVGNNLVQGKIASYVDLASWRSVAERVIEELDLETTPESLVNRVSVSNEERTSVLHVTASADDPYLARDLAEAWVRSMIVEINTVETGNPEDGGSIEVLPGDSARVPSSPSSPNTRLYLAVGLLGGLVAGLGYGVLRYTLDRRVRSAEQVERETGVSVVGSIPAVKAFTDDDHLLPVEGDARTQDEEIYAVSEAMRALRTNLQFMDVDNPPRVIVVTSPLPGDGKSTTSANLALTLAATGERVVLIDGDLRRPTITKVFSLIEGAGLTDVLAGRAEIEDVAHRVGKNLVVIGPGQIPPNPSEVLGSERMHHLLEQLAQQAMVIIDAPPLLPVTDAAILARRADGAIVVTRVGTTTSEVLRKGLQNLAQVKARALGVVLNRVPMRGAGAVYYGYQYRGGYYRSAEEAGTGKAGKKPRSSDEAGSPRRTARTQYRRRTGAEERTTVPGGN